MPPIFWPMAAAQEKYCESEPKLSYVEMKSLVTAPNGQTLTLRGVEGLDPCGSTGDIECCSL